MCAGASDEICGRNLSIRSTVESVIEVGIVYNFWILGANFYSSFYPFF